MKKSLLAAALLGFSLNVFSQGKIIQKIKADVNKTEIEAHMTFLAADEMRGRDTGSPEVAIAANYLAAQYAITGLKKVPGMDSYFQEVALRKIMAPTTLDLKLGNEFFKINDDLVQYKGRSLAYEGEFVFIGYGLEPDYAGVDVKGKVVVTNAGSSEKSTLRSAIRDDSETKYALAKKNGAIAIIELVSFPDAPWERIAGYFRSGGAIGTAGPELEAMDMPLLLMRKSDNPAITALMNQKKSRGTLIVERQIPLPVPGKNIIGLIPGTDPKLKEEYVVLSAHYDHVGVRKNGTPDSIYNGARDNALGTAAILEAAKFLVKNPVKRSVLIIAYCAEEKGLVGSFWYAKHPAVPLAKTVYNLDCDGAGYNDKSIATLIDLNRTTADEILKNATKAFGLTLVGDPVPDQNLFERSDNYNFAVEGVPAVDFSPGIKGFDEELMKYYHQAADEVASLDFDYLEKFVRAYVYSSYGVGNAAVTPTWKAGDKFESAGKKLYGK